MTLPNGKTYDIPDSEVVVAQSQYGAVPAEGPIARSRTPEPQSGLGGVLGAVGQATSGLKGVGLGIGIPSAIWLGRRAFGNRGGGAPGKPIRLSRRDVTEVPEFRRFKAGQQISPELYENTMVKRGLMDEQMAQAKARADLIAAQNKRVDETQGMKPRTRGGRIVGKIEPPTEPRPTLPPEEAGGPAQRATAGGLEAPRAPRATQGASTPELARRMAAREAAIGGPPSTGSDLESQLEQSLRSASAARRAATEAGIPEVGAELAARAARGAVHVPGILGLLLDLATVRGQMEDVNRMGLLESPRERELRQRFAGPNRIL
jgi:hypothetical protein